MGGVESFSYKNFKLFVLRWRYAILRRCLLCRQLFHDWTVELKGMADRIITMRHQLYDALKQKGKTPLSDQTSQPPLSDQARQPLLRSSSCLYSNKTAL
jgi:hypothetical protein